MALTGVHVLLTYQCNYACDHCFLYCSPDSRGTFTTPRLTELLEQANELGTVSWIYFEGGEPFLFYPVMLEGIRLARDMGFKAGVVTNGYWATSDEDAYVWLKPIAEIGIDDLSVSDDEFHHGGESERPAVHARRVARELGMPVNALRIDAPTVKPQVDKGQPVIGGGVLLKGRAADTLSEGLPTRPVDTFRTCPYEDLTSPDRVHVDAFGHVHVCQGISIGNVWETPLPAIVREYDAARHPICGPLVRGGPAALAAERGVALDGSFVDECHYCFALRRSLIECYPQTLTPRQVYGFDVPAA